MKACMIDFKESWEDHLHLTAFSYNGSYQASIKITPFEALYGRKCRSPLCWVEVGERRLLGPQVIVQAVNKVRTIREQLRQHRVGRKVGQTQTKDH